MKISDINLQQPNLGSVVNEDFTSPPSQSRDSINHKVARSYIGECFNGLVIALSWVGGLALLQWTWTGITFLFKLLGCCVGESKEPTISWEKIRYQTHRAILDTKKHLDGVQKVALFIWSGGKVHKQFLELENLDTIHTILEEAKEKFTKPLGVENPTFTIGFFLLKGDEQSSTIISRSINKEGISERILDSQYQGNLAESDSKLLNNLFTKLKEKI